MNHDKNEVYLSTLFFKFIPRLGRVNPSINREDVFCDKKKIGQFCPQIVTLLFFGVSGGGSKKNPHSHNSTNAQMVFFRSAIVRNRFVAVRVTFWGKKVYFVDIWP